MKLTIKNSACFSTKIALAMSIISIIIILLYVLLGAGLLMVIINFFCGMFAIPFILSYLQSLSLVLVLWILKNLI